MRFFIAFFLIFNLYGATRTSYLMGTFVTIKTSKADREFIQDGFEIVKDIENSLSTFKSSSPVYILNEGKKIKPDLYLKEILKKSKEIYKKTDGYFDVAIGKITKDIYDFGGKEHLPASKVDVKTDIKGIKSSNGYIVLDGIKLDFGGIAKGYAVDKVSSYYKKYGVKAIVALSGDIRCLGKCRVYIDSPFKEKSSLFYIDAKSEFGISTSGIYRRYIKKQKYNHIINPYTKKPQTKIVSLSLFGKTDNTTLDAFSTAIVAMGFEKALLYLKKHKLNYILVTDDKKVYINRGVYGINLINHSVYLVYGHENKIKHKYKK